MHEGELHKCSPSRRRLVFRSLYAVHSNKHTWNSYGKGLRTPQIYDSCNIPGYPINGS
jgi:hypothetical protein